MLETAQICAAVLAGGKGTRLRGVVADRPKALAPVAGRPFLAYLLDQLSAAGLGRVVLCTGYLAEQIRQSVGPRHGSLAVAYSREPEPLDTGGALRLALPLLDSDPVLVANGDSFLDCDLRGFLQWYQAKERRAAMVLANVEDAGRYGSVRLSGDERISAFMEKGGDDGAGWINAGVYLFSRRLIETIPAGRPCSLEREVFPELIDQGLYGYRCPGRFIDIGTEQSYRQAQRFFRDPGR